MMDKFRFLICLLTMCVGVIFGLLLSGVNLNSLSGWKEVLELFSYIATISMAIFAIWTLDAWKAQFGFGKRFEALKELGDSFEDLRVILKHIEHMENYYFRKATGESDDELAMLLSDLEQTGKKWDASITRYSKAWRSSLLFITEDEFVSFPIPPLELRSKIRTDLRKYVNEINGRTGFDACIYIKFKAGEIHNEIVNVFRETDLLMFEIIKKALSR